MISRGSVIGLVILTAHCAGSGKRLGGSTTLSGRVIGGTSASEKAGLGNERFEQMALLLKRGLQLEADAREEHDVKHARCVVDRVTVLKKLVDVAGAARTTLQRAAADGDEGVTDHQLERLRVALEKAQQMSKEAETCVGKSSTGGQVKVQ